MGYRYRSYSYLKDIRKYYEQLYDSKFDKWTNSMKIQLTKLTQEAANMNSSLMYKEQISYSEISCLVSLVNSDI